MEHRSNEAREVIEDGARNHGLKDPLGIRSHDPRRGEEDERPNAAIRAPAARGPVPKRDVTSSWANWQSVLYAFVLGVACLLLVPLTSLWWIVPVLGAAVPLALAALERTDLRSGGPEVKIGKQGELLKALAERGEITPTTAAKRTSLTVDEASKMLDELAGEGHLKLQAEDGVMAYAPKRRGLHPAPGEVYTSPDLASRDRSDPKRLQEPLSERELEVLSLLASGRTNAEIARDLFVAVGTVKSHTGNIYRKVDARNRAEAVSRAREMNLLS
jgi:DNA-binding CsgD family transcriptional regulator